MLHKARNNSPEIKEQENNSSPLNKFKSESNIKERNIRIADNSVDLDEINVNSGTLFLLPKKKKYKFDDEELNKDSEKGFIKNDNSRNHSFCTFTHKAFFCILIFILAIVLIYVLDFSGSQSNYFSL